MDTNVVVCRFRAGYYEQRDITDHQLPGPGHRGSVRAVREQGSRWGGPQKEQRVDWAQVGLLSFQKSKSPKICCAAVSLTAAADFLPLGFKLNLLMKGRILIVRCLASKSKLWNESTRALWAGSGRALTGRAGWLALRAGSHRAGKLGQAGCGWFGRKRGGQSLYPHHHRDNREEL